MATKSKHSIEEKIEDWCKKQFKGQKYYTKTETINSEIDFALEKAPSKQGGVLERTTLISSICLPPITVEEFLL